MIRVAVYKLSQLMGKVSSSEGEALKFEGDDNFKAFIASLKDGDDYASDREFLRDLPERLTSYVHAHIEVDN